jgi:hypothetical protein
MIPHERSLVQRLQSKPFALIGVNSDKDPEALKRELATHQVNWRSFKNQLPQGDTISKNWQVRGWPTLFLIDHRGVIRHKWVGKPDDATLEELIDSLIREAERDQRKS